MRAFNTHSPADKILQHGGLSGALTADDGNLRQVDGHVYAQLREGVLHPVDDGDERLHALVPRHLVGLPVALPLVVSLLWADITPPPLAVSSLFT